MRARPSAPAPCAGERRLEPSARSCRQSASGGVAAPRHPSSPPPPPLLTCAGAFTCDAHHMTEPQPEGKGVILCIERALAASGVAPEEVGCQGGRLRVACCWACRQLTLCGHCGADGGAARRATAAARPGHPAASLPGTGFNATPEAPRRLNQTSTACTAPSFLHPPPPHCPHSITHFRWATSTRTAPPRPPATWLSIAPSPPRCRTSGWLLGCWCRGFAVWQAGLASGCGC